MKIEFAYKKIPEVDFLTSGILFEIALPST